MRQVLAELMLEPGPGGPVVLVDESPERLAVGKQSGCPTLAGRLEGGGVHAYVIDRPRHAGDPWRE